MSWLNMCQLRSFLAKKETFFEPKNKNKIDPYSNDFPLRFSSRMMNVTVDPAVNEIIDPMRMMQKLDAEVKTLRQELAMHDTLVNRKSGAYEPMSEHQLLEIENQCRRFIEGSLDEIEVSSLRQIQVQ